MGIFKKKVVLEELMDLEAVMKKYDQESNVRLWEGKPKIAVNAVLAIFSLFCLYVTLFASWLEELRLMTIEVVSSISSSIGVILSVPLTALISSVILTKGKA